MRTYRIIRFLVSCALRSLKDSWRLHAVTVGTIATTFVVLGGAYIVFDNVRALLVGSEGRLHISVYFETGGEKKGRGTVEKEFCGRPFISECAFRSAKAARTYFVDANPGLEKAIASLDVNPFPASMEIEIDPEFRDEGVLRTLAADMRKIGGVEEVDDGGDWTGRWVMLLSLADWGMWTLGIALGLAMIFIVANTIKLVVYSRRDEVEILNLVGCTDLTIRSPFLFEGMLQGMMGVLISIVILRFAFFFSQRFVVEQWGSLLTGSFRFPPFDVQVLALGLGALLGFLGSAFAVGRYLRA